MKSRIVRLLLAFSLLAPSAALADDPPDEATEPEAEAEAEAEAEPEAEAEAEPEAEAEAAPPALCLCPCPSAEIAEGTPVDPEPPVVAEAEPAPPVVAPPVEEAPAEEAGGEVVAAAARTVPRGPACMSQPVELVRVWGAQQTETARVRLTTCDGEPWPEGVDQLSVLARPLDADRPTRAQQRRYARNAALGRGDPAFVAEGVRRLDSGLAQRLQAIATQFPGKRIVIVSGFRPNARATSRHRHARALDIRLEDVTKEELVEFARTLAETGVGYYPNSVLTHVDVRDRRAYWVDRSAPGEAADYGPWPAQDEDLTPQELLSRSLEALDRIAEQEEDAGGAAESHEGSDDAEVEAPPTEQPAVDEPPTSERDETRDELIRRVMEGANELAPIPEAPPEEQPILVR